MNEVVCLDAGHDIYTPGKRSFDGRLREYEFNRAVLQQMVPILKQSGYKVVVTTPDNKAVTLPRRCKIANDAHADIFVSLHANAFGRTWNTANGWEVLVDHLGGESERLAKCFEKESVILGLHNRGVKVNDNLTVLMKTNMPAILVEHGFFTNEEEMHKLLSGEFRHLAAIANCRAIDAYFANKAGK